MSCRAVEAPSVTEAWPGGCCHHGLNVPRFSRKILWLKVGRSNNNPYVVGYHYIEFVGKEEGVPRCIRMNRGSENVFIEDIQMAFRWDHVDDMAGQRSVIYGSSHRNQRIERWWLTLRQSGVSYWINFMKNLESEGLLSTDDNLHIERLRFCFTEILQMELDQIAMEWNQHSFSTRSSTEGCVHGKPDLLYYMPELYGTVDYKTSVNPRDVQAIKLMCEKPRSSGCEEDFENICNLILQQHGRSKPRSEEEPLEMYGWLLSKLH